MNGAEVVDQTFSVSALVGISWRKQPVSLSLQEPAGLLHLESPIVGAVLRDPNLTAFAK
jgi:hypothetical protein